MYIYADMILLVNCIMNFLVFTVTAHATGISFKYKRVFAASLVGSFYALGEVLPETALLYSPLGKLAASILLIVTAFGRRPIKAIVIIIGAFYIISFLFGGAVLGWIYFTQNGLPGGDGTISWTNLAAGSMLAMTLFIFITRRMIGRVYRKRTLYPSRIEYNGHVKEVVGMMDTGNSLFSLFGGKPVVIIGKNEAIDIVSSEAAAFLNNYSIDAWLENLNNCLDTRWLGRVEIIPYQSVGKRSMLLGFRPDSITVITESGTICTTNLLIGISDELFTTDGEYRAILHPALITGAKMTKEADTCALPGQ